jgi:hypothetical protein
VTFPRAGRDNSSQEDAGVCAPSLDWLVSHRWPWAGSGQDGTGPASVSSSAPGIAPAVQDERSIALCRRVAACAGGHRAHGCGGGRVPFSRTSSPQTSPDTAPYMAAPTTIPAPTSTVYAKPTRNPALTVQIGFETGLAGWRPIGAARIQRDPLAREGRWAARFNGTGVADQGTALPAVLRCKPGKSYDHRTHWSGPDPPAVAADPDHRQVVVPNWQIPLPVGQRTALIQGDIVWVPGPSPCPGGCWRRPRSRSWSWLAGVAGTA